MTNRNQLLKIFKKAQKENYPIFQFNFSTVEQLKGIIEGVKKFNCPIILGTSEGESSFLSLEVAVEMKKIAQKALGKNKVFLNFDHGKSFDIISQAIKAGYDMVHFDGGNLDLQENIKITKKIVEYGKKRDVVVEGEVGFIEQSSVIHKGKPKIKLENLTDPDDAKLFVQKTRVDSLAVSIGNVHGVYQRAENFKLDLERLSVIKREVGDDVFLVLHGGSGISFNQLKKSIEKGIVKININTEIRTAWRKALEKSLKNSPNEITPYKLMSSVTEAIQKTIEKKLKLFY
ncbi:MAG TPA: class II fructose-bisphosphate aldolase [Candidatus Paceibacterota bacterium]|nr:class II fructose-bisphosphate aldolase [Candidatus Paceibacterota bacterium]